MSISKWRGTMLVAGSVAIALIGTSAALADERQSVDCTIRFQLSGWSAIYDRVDGTGIVACSDGTSLAVEIRARGVGLTLGRPKLTDGSGEFASVHQISDVFGTYGEGDPYAGVGKSAAAHVLTNGTVSLRLAGRGEDYDFGIDITGFTVRPR